MIEIITIGDEILSGRTQDTNSGRLAGLLQAAGYSVRQIRTIADDETAIETALSAVRAQAAIMTGGLGPTEDDRTRKTLSRYFNSELIEHTPTREKIEGFFRERNRTPNEHTLRMAFAPACAEILPNNAGAAPGLKFALPMGRTLYVLPGVPYEMLHIFEKSVLPDLRQNFPTDYWEWETFRTVGIPESSLSILLKDIENALPPEIKFAYYPNLQTLDLRTRLRCKPEDSERWAPRFAEIKSAITERISEFLYATGERTLPAVLIDKLRDLKWTFAAAESCTGGALTARLTTIPGASDVVKGAVVAYANEIKIERLGVNAETLATHGAVSEAVAIEMAGGARRALNADVALSITGVAGPGGGTTEKPVGTVWIGYADADGEHAKRFTFEKDRVRNIERSVTAALALLFHQIRGR